MRILPTICTHRCSVCFVASHEARGSSGSSTRSRTLLNAAPPGPIDSGYLGLPRLREEALAAPEDDREHHQAQLVDEVVLDQRLHELGAAVDHDVPVLLLLQLGDL